MTSPSFFAALTTVLRLFNSNVVQLLPLTLYCVSTPTPLAVSDDVFNASTVLFPENALPLGVKITGKPSGQSKVICQSIFSLVE